MTRRNEKPAAGVCPKTGRPIDRTWRHRWLPWVFPFVGAASLLWFLIRVLPKPARAAYPCQRLAAPLASGFVVWLTGIVASTLAYRRAQRLASQARYVAAGVLVAVAVAAIWWSLGITAERGVQAAFTPSDPPNRPMGVGKGIHPGRVVWVHDPEATGWDGQTLLYLIDGLDATRSQSVEVIRFTSFGNDRTSSLFMSQDPVAIDSVALDFIRNEPLETDCTGQGVDNYLHEAALADNPPSRSVYDPDGDGVRLQSLGVHEHWNNAVEKKYSRNLGKTSGIELVVPSLVVENGPVENKTKGTKYKHIRHAGQDANEGDTIIVAPGVYKETVSFSGKALWIESTNPIDPNVVATTVIEGAMEGVSFTNGEDANAVVAGFTIRGATRGIYCQGAAPAIVHCRIVDNVEAGIKVWDSGNPTVANCIIAGHGGDGIERWASRVSRVITYNYGTVLHCTIVGNGGNGLRGGKPLVVNTIVRANGTAAGASQISADVATVTYSDVQGGQPGAGNIDADPMFVVPGYWADPADLNRPAVLSDGKAVWVGGDYHLKAGSPCIDAGDPTFPSRWMLLDIDGDMRPIGGISDIGCDEFAAPPPSWPKSPPGRRVAALMLP